MKQKEFNVDDFVAGDKSFPVEVRDRDGNLLKSIQLKITIDDQDERTIDPEDDGTFNISPVPEKTLKLSVVG